MRKLKENNSWSIPEIEQALKYIQPADLIVSFNMHGRLGENMEVVYEDVTNVQLTKSEIKIKGRMFLMRFPMSLIKEIHGLYSNPEEITFVFQYGIEVTLS